VLLGAVYIEAIDNNTDVKTIFKEKYIAKLG
jgi:hypothetical protein